MVLDEIERVFNELDRMKYLSLDKKEVEEILKDLEILTTEVHLIDEKIDFKDLIMALEESKYQDFLGKVSLKIEEIDNIRENKEKRVSTQEDSKIVEILNSKKEILNRIYDYIKDIAN